MTSNFVLFHLISSGFCTVFAILLLIGSSVEVATNDSAPKSKSKTKTSVVIQLLLAFSMQKNFREITTVNPRYELMHV